MRLKRLELFGFKSFAERTSLEFGPGITAVVGPNGCGKSNLAESIRWVLGEQSARELRGYRMEDVIFSGSNTRKPLSIAEASITLDNSLQTLPVEFSEVTIARRVSRDGTSTYLINRSEARLKDVQELLAGTGLGQVSYSIVSQGRIDEILNARPEERRLLLEEVAGLTAFRRRKLAAMRKVDAADFRMLRLGDMLGELRGRLDPLRREARRAREYREYASRLAELEIAMLMDQLAGVLSEEKEASRQCTSLKDRASKLGAREEVVAAANNDLKRNLASLEEEGEKLRQLVEDGVARRERFSERRASLERRTLELEGDIRQLTQELSDLERRLVNEKKSEESREEALAGLRSVLASGDREVERLAGEIEALEGQLDENKQVLETLRGRALEFSRRTVRLDGDYETFAKTAAELDRSLEALKVQRTSLHKKEEQHEAELVASRDSLEDLETGLSHLRERAEGIATEEAALEGRRKTLEAEKATLREELSRVRARYDLLREMHREYQGFDRGVAAVLRGVRVGDRGFAGVLGVVAELVSPREGAERAVEAALDTSLQWLISKDQVAALHCIEALRKKGSGRATFLPLESAAAEATLEGVSPDIASLLSVEGVVGRALDLVEYDPRLEPVMTRLLGSILVVQDLEVARTLGAACNFRLKIVTTAGEVVHAGGALTGGSAAPADASFISRSAELERLPAEISVLEKRMDILVAEGEQVTGWWEKLRSERHRLEREITRAELEKRDLEARREASRSRLERTKMTLADLETEIRDMVKRKEETELKAKEAAIELARASEKETSCRSQMTALEQKVKQQEGLVARLREDLTAQMVQMAGLRQKEKDLLAGAGVGTQPSDLAGRVDDRRRILAAREKELAEVARGLEEARTLEQEARNDVEEGRRLQALWTERRSTLLASVDDGERLLARIREETARCTEQLRQAEEKLARLRVAAAETRETIREQLGRDPAVLPPAPRVHNRAAIRSEMQNLKQKMEELEPVNHRAPEEYRQVLDRYRFLQSQSEDLQGARQSLDELAGRMDLVIKDRFAKTFEQVQKVFDEVFRDLFGGGSARLELTETEDPLGGGVDIIAQPPGKKLSHLSLLSGGERALAAIAFVFTLLRIKPVSFCVLDEIDAPLDDINVRKFVDYLKRYADQIQFVLVTHQKATMEAADTLFGLTMEEAGISRIVSVRIEEAC